MDFVRKSLNKWIQAAIVMVIGILVIVAGAQMGSNNDPSDTINAISLILGIVLLVIGSFGILAGIFASIFSKQGFASAALTSGIILAAGIWFVVYKDAYTLIAMLIQFLPFVLIAAGCILFVDAGISAIPGIKGKKWKAVIPALVVGALLAIASIVIGALCIAKDSNGYSTIIPGNVQLIIFGVIVLVYSIFMVLSTFIVIPVATAVVVEQKEAPKEEKAEEVEAK